MRHPLLEWTLTRASAADGAKYAAALPRMERSVARTASGAKLVLRLCEDERWAARYLAARRLGRLVPELVATDEAWRRLLVLAADHVPVVREAVPVGMAALVEREPVAGQRLERLLLDRSAPRLTRRAAVRALVPLTLCPTTEELGERLLRAVALADAEVSRGIGAVILGRGIGASDPEHARRIASAWAISDEEALHRQAARALGGPLAGPDNARPPDRGLGSVKRRWPMEAA